MNNQPSVILKLTITADKSSWLLTWIDEVEEPPRSRVLDEANHLSNVTKEQKQPNNQLIRIWIQAQTTVCSSARKHSHFPTRVLPSGNLKTGPRPNWNYLSWTYLLVNNELRHSIWNGFWAAWDALRNEKGELAHSGSILPPQRLARGKEIDGAAWRLAWLWKRVCMDDKNWNKSLSCWVHRCFMQDRWYFTHAR